MKDDLSLLVLVAALGCSSVAAQMLGGAASSERAPQVPLAAVEVGSADLEFMIYAAHMNHAQTTAARLALERSQNEQVRNAARRLLDDHLAAQQELARIAAGKGVALPARPSRQQQYGLDALRGLQGLHFDSSYLESVAVGAHRDASARFHVHATAGGGDPVVTGYARAMLPRLAMHLATAETLLAELDPIFPSWNANAFAAAGAMESKKLVEEAVEVLDQMQDSPDAARMLSRAYGVLVIPEHRRAALGVGLQGGKGVLVARDGESYSNPVFYGLTGVSLGAQAGVAAGPVVFLLMTERALQDFRSEREFSVNLDLAGALGPFAAREQASVGKMQDVVVWSGSSGAFAGLALGVASVKADQEANRAYYGSHDATPLKILGGRVPNPHQRVLAQVLGN